MSATLRVETPHARQAQPQKHTRAATKRVRAPAARWQAQSGVCTCALTRSRTRAREGAREREWRHIRRVADAPKSGTPSLELIARLAPGVRARAGDG